MHVHIKIHHTQKQVGAILSRSTLYGFLQYFVKLHRCFSSMSGAKQKSSGSKFAHSPNSELVLEVLQAEGTAKKGNNAKGPFPENSSAGEALQHKSFPPKQLGLEAMLINQLINYICLWVTS